MSKRKQQSLAVMSGQLLNVGSGAHGALSSHTAEVIPGSKESMVERG